ncbi:GNAT family N-acetyltransferase [Actinoplanes sp. NPDC051494]|uniref:GNAT family N-acetyltransferase n=1 Tax=Actinoplanes sp. NPDC051494 TaxID=3363907 RepID=UPI00378D7483
MSVHLRPAADDDLPGIGDLHYRSRASAYSHLLTPEALTFGSPAALGEWWTERWKWERDNHRLTVAVAGDTLAGFTYLGPGEDPDTGELSAIHADPDFVGKGVGRALMVDALGALIPYGKSAVLWVLEGNAVARSFYEKGGWTPDGVTRVEPVGSEPVLQMRYRIALGRQGGSA